MYIEYYLSKLYEAGINEQNVELYLDIAETAMKRDISKIVNSLTDEDLENLREILR